MRGWGDIASALTAVSGAGAPGVVHASGTAAAAAAAAANMKKRKVIDSERIFTFSSVSARPLLQADSLADGDNDTIDFLSTRPSKVAKITTSSKKKTTAPRKRPQPPLAIPTGAPAPPDALFSEAEPIQDI